MLPSPEQPASAEPETCLNCGSPVPARYCGSCGQERAPLRLPLQQIVQDYLGDAFNLEVRLARTLAPLVLRPGFLTREYLAGRRVHYTPPLRLFLVASLAFGAVWLLTRPADQAFYGIEYADAGAYAQTLARGLLLAVPVVALGLKLLYVRSGALPR